MTEFTVDQQNYLRALHDLRDYRDTLIPESQRRVAETEAALVRHNDLLKYYEDQAANLEKWLEENSAHNPTPEAPKTKWWQK